MAGHVANRCPGLRVGNPGQAAIGELRGVARRGAACSNDGSGINLTAAGKPLFGDHAGKPDEQGFLVAAELLAVAATLGSGPAQADQLIQDNGLERDGQLGGRYGFTSREIVRRADGSFEIVIAPRANPGNWLPTGGIERYQLVLRLYDTAVGVSTKAGREVPMPAVSTRSCQ